MILNKTIITVSREFGSGGRTIAKTLAEKLGFAYYDKALVKQVALETGFAPAFVEERGEDSPEKSPLSYLLDSCGASGAMGGMNASDYLWTMQREVILSFADSGSCVIVGRCADFILKDRDDCFNVYIHADLSFRMERIVRLYGESEQSPKRRVLEKDAKRRANYEHFTGQKWGLAQNYHLTMNSAAIGIERCVSAILGLV